MWTRPSLPGKSLDERAVGLDSDDLAGVDLADLDLDLVGHALDALDRVISALLVDRGDRNRAVVGNVDLGAGLFLQGADILATRADEQADLVRVDLDLRDARREL